MNWPRFFRRNNADADQRRELESYLEHATDELIGRGIKPEAARAAATRKLGNAMQLCEEVYRMNTISLIEETARNVRFSLRTLRKNPAFTAAAIFTMAIGIGANTAVFSVVDGVLLKPLAYREPARLVSISHVAPGLAGVTAETGLHLSASMYFTYSEQNRSFEEMGIWTPSQVSVNGARDPEQVLAIAVSPGALEALGVKPELGRWFSGDDQKPSAAPTILLTHGYWQQRFGGDASVIGRKLMVDSLPRQVIGIMPKSFRMADVPAAIITPLQLDRTRTTLAGFYLNSVGRLKPGVSIEQAQADIARLIPIWMRSWGSIPGSGAGDARAIQVYESWRISPHLQPLRDTIVGNVGDVLWVVMGTLGAVMLIVCANVANLLLVHVEGRRRELAVRAALGAGRGRLVRELLAESAVLVSAGAALGLGLAMAGIGLLQWIAPANLPRLNEIAVDGRAALFTSAITAISALLLGLIPAWRYGGRLSLREGGRTASAGPEQQRARNALVVVQVSLALVLLIGSGLMIRTFQKMRNVDPGFTEARQLQTVRLAIPQALVQDNERVARMEQDIRGRLAAIPGVAEAGFADAVPMDGGHLNWDGIFAEGQPVPPGAYPPARVFRWIAPGFFQSMGTRLLAGRDYTWGDLYGSTKRVILSENLARDFWGSAAAAIGKRVRVTPYSPWFEVIGVAEDVRITGVHEKAPETVYWRTYGPLPWFENFRNVVREPVFVIRSPRAGTQALAEDLRKAIWSANGNLAIADILTMEQIAGRSMARTSFTLVMLAIAGAMALLLGVIGIYGVVAYTVAQRRKEVGIRLALGADPAAVKGMFLRQGLILSAFGCGVGIVGAMALSRLMASLLFGVKPLDPVTYAVMPAVLLAAAAVACYLPARRAAAVDPVETLRAE
ncbi:MAG: ABC transporter permease [Bryobacterales bacterium]|nr:ABC transporter permease [Bryobacterales bacterium]MBV9398887.1 ABC transporter permease [Bryobacterales bacterium]